VVQRLVGVDIGSASIRAVEVEAPSTPRARVVRRREVPLPEGATNQGEVVDAAVVAERLRRLWSAAGFKTKKVVLGIGGQRIMARDLTVPRMSIAQIRQSLPYQVQDTLPVPVADLLLDFYPVDEHGGEHGPVVSGLLIAALRESVQANVEAVLLAGLEPVVVDVVPFALIRALEAQVRGDDVVAVVDVGASTTSVVVAARGVPRFVRVIKVGGDAVTARLGESLGIEALEAEQLKRRVDLRAESVGEDEEEARRLLGEFERTLLGSLRTTLGYYMRNEDAGAIDRLTGFAEALAELSGIAVTYGMPFERVTGDVRLATGDADHTYAVALGLALGNAA
jgi:type IV pilus assembly protein PilM